MENRSSKIVVIGSCMIDLMCYAPHLPKAGETIHGYAFKKDCGGKGANQCVAAARLGATTALVARLGNDTFGHEYKQHLKANGVNTDHVILTKDVSCGIAQISVADNGENSIIIFAGANNLLSTEDIHRASGTLSLASVVIFQFETPLETTLEALLLIKRINPKKCISIVNAAPAKANIDKRLYSLSDIFCVNETEAEIMTGLPTSTVDQCEKALLLFLEMECNTIILTMGKNGVLFASKDSRTPVHVPGEPVEKPVDTTGAGDAFIGALAYLLAYHKDWNMTRMIEVACTVAARSIMKPGTQSSFPSVEDLPLDLFSDVSFLAI